MCYLIFAEVYSAILLAQESDVVFLNIDLDQMTTNVPKLDFQGVRHKVIPLQYLKVLPRPMFWYRI